MMTYLRAIKNLVPISLRGLCAALLCALALKYLAVAEMDLVTFALCGPLLGLIFFLSILTPILRIRIKKRIKISPNFDSENLFSNSNISTGLTLKNSSLPPYYHLQIRRVFEPGEVESALHLIKGKEPTLGKRHIIDSVIFPHRGNWSLSHLELTLSDSLGLSQSTWNYPVSLALKVSPPHLAIKPLPIIAASSRAGDEMNLPMERRGDMFDIKQYDPSDGINRILWKTYARSAELHVRRPEPAIIPEGEVAIYLIADRLEDHVASAALSYVNYLIENDIVVLFGTDGLSDEKLYANTNDEILEFVRTGATQQSAGTGKDFSNFIASITSNNISLGQVVIFAAQEKSGTLALGPWFNPVQQAATANGIKLCLALVPDTIAPRFWERKSESKNTNIVDAKTIGHEVEFFKVESDENYVY